MDEIYLRLKLEDGLRAAQEGRVVPELPRSEVRELLFQVDRIIHRLSPGRIDVRAQVHGARDLSRQQDAPWDVG